MLVIFFIMGAKDVLKEDIAHIRLYIGIFYTATLAIAFVLFQTYQDIPPFLFLLLSVVCVGSGFSWALYERRYKRKIKELQEI